MSEEAIGGMFIFALLIIGACIDYFNKGKNDEESN